MTLVSLADRAVAHNLSLGPVEDISIAFYDHSLGGSMRVDFDANRERHAVADIADRQRQFLRMLGSIDAVDAAHWVVLRFCRRPSGVCCWRTGTRRRVRCRVRAWSDLFAAQAARDAGCGCGGARGSRAELRGAGCAVEPSGAPSARRWGSARRRLWVCYVERSLETVIGLLGILKAGAAYLPLDPSYPAERLAFMLSDARCAVLVTQRRCSSGCRRPVRSLAAAPAARRARRARWCGSTPTGRAIARQPADAARHRHRARPGRLRHLHIGLNRNPKGRGGRAWRHSQSGCGADRALRHHRLKSRVLAVCVAEFRCGGV